MKDMKKRLNIKLRENVICACTDIVYAQRKYWCDTAIRPLKLSMIYPRTFFKYDPKDKLPVILWLCGGAFTEVDHNVWLPELTYFAKHGYAIASVEYSVFSRTKFPQQIIDIKEAIRFLRANSGFYNINADNIAVMGESAGGYLTAAAAVTGETKEFDQGENLEYSSSVQAAVPWYPPVDMKELADMGNSAEFPKDLAQYLNPISLISEKTPPFLILHGMKDSQINYKNSEILYEALQQEGVPSDLCLIEDAEHADTPFVQKEIKDIILQFLDKYMK